MSHVNYDVLIVGGGLVGLSLARALAPSGLRMGIVESKQLAPSETPRYDDRTLALAYGSRRIFEGMGIWREVEARGVTAIKRIHVSDRGRFGIARLDATDAGIEALGYVVAMPALGTTLYEAVRRCDGVDLICPAVVRSVERAADRVSVDVQRDGQAKTLSARLVVGADGGRSRVRAAADIKATHKDYQQSAVVTTVTPELPHRNVAYERFTESGPLALLPMTENRCTVVWSTQRDDVEEILDLDDATFLARLQAGFGDRLGSFLRVGSRQTYPLFLTRIETQVRARLALVGNAAHTVHPVAGQGFNLGLRDVATLAEITVEEMRRGGDIGDIEVLARYVHQRRRDTEAVTTFTDGLIRIFANSISPLVLARNVGLIATDVWLPVKRALIQRTSGLHGRLPRLARGLPLVREPLAVSREQ
ncbi:MAG: 2-octaprenyl-6-methoxyphenyl hydroxylase [Acidiferrobacterales bacterium]